MEFRSDLRLTLKSSCDACTNSKVKCSGEDPCARCVKKGIQCFYSPKKKRGPVRRQERTALVANQPMVVTTSISGAKQMSSLGSHERRSWSVFFTLYKHYAVSCSLFWFNRQLHKMREYLIKQDKKDALKRLNSWMEALNIDIDDLVSKVNACQLKIRQWGKEGQAKSDLQKTLEMNEDTARHLNLGNPFHLRVDGHVTDTDTPQPLKTGFLGGFNTESSVASINFKVDYMQPSADPVVSANQAFADLMGYDGTEIEKDLSGSGGGFLPWGGDVLSRILINEADLLSFVQILAIKFNTMGKPTHYPIVREVPSCHVFNVNWRDSKTKGPVSCVIKCVHREIISDTESSLDVLMSFEPMNSTAKFSDVTPDAALATMDEIELPPKRVKKSHYQPQPQEQQQRGPEMKAEAQSEAGSTFYNYVTAQDDLGVALEGQENGTFVQPQQQQDFSAQAQPPALEAQHSFAGAIPKLQDDEADFLDLKSSGEALFPDSKLQQDQQRHPLHHQENYNKAPPSAVDSPSSFDDDIIGTLPLVDSSDEESLDVNGDDSEWLDELLNWTGPAVV